MKLSSLALAAALFLSRILKAGSVLGRRTLNSFVDLPALSNDHGFGESAVADSIGLVQRHSPPPREEIRRHFLPKRAPRRHWNLRRWRARRQR